MVAGMEKAPEEVPNEED
jgi:hypothetical protein